MSLVTVLKCMPAGDPSGFTGSEDPGARCVVRSAASAATREAMLNALARGDSGPRASIGARRPGRRRLRLHAPGPTEAGPAHGPGAGARGATHRCAPCPGDVASRPPTPGRGGPGGWRAPGGGAGPPAFQAPGPSPQLPGASVASTPGPSAAPRGLAFLCTAKPPASTTPRGGYSRRPRPQAPAAGFRRALPCAPPASPAAPAPGRGEDRPGSGSGHGQKAPGLQGRPFLGAQGRDLAPRAAPGPLWAAHGRAWGP